MLRIYSVFKHFIQLLLAIEKEINISALHVYKFENVCVSYFCVLWQWREGHYLEKLLN